jgi:hypothetical protein
MARCDLTMLPDAIFAVVVFTLAHYRVIQIEWYAPKCLLRWIKGGVTDL